MNRPGSGQGRTECEAAVRSADRYLRARPPCPLDNCGPIGAARAESRVLAAMPEPAVLCPHQLRSRHQLSAHTRREGPSLIPSRWSPSVTDAGAPVDHDRQRSIADQLAVAPGKSTQPITSSHVLRRRKVTTGGAAIHPRSGRLTHTFADTAFITSGRSQATAWNSPRSDLAPHGAPWQHARA
jgi:hypothetical protein